MCELTLAYCKNDEFKRAYLTAQAVVNSSKHKDGIGVFESKILGKNHVPSLESIQELVLNSKYSHIGTALHCRKATTFKGANNVCFEQTHPFETEAMILAHNGVLTFEKPLGLEAEREAHIDSEALAILLTKLLSNGTCTSIPEALELAMREYVRGKFALIIWDKLAGRWVIARGKADLHCMRGTFGEHPFLVINTEGPDLTSAMNQVQYYALVRGIPFSKDTLQYLVEEQVYTVNIESLGLQILGEVKQRFPLVATYTPYQGRGSIYDTRWDALGDDDDPNVYSIRQTAKVRQYEETPLSPAELVILGEMLGFDISKQTEIESLIDTVILFAGEDTKLPMSYGRGKMAGLTHILENEYSLPYCLFSEEVKSGD